MDLTTLLQSIQSSLGQNLPSVLGAVGIFVIGWLVAVAVRASVRKGLSAISLNRWLKSKAELNVDIERWVAVILFWVILLITLIAVFNSVHLERASDPFNTMITQVLAYLPRIVAALLLALLAWVIGTVVRAVVSRSLSATGLDKKLGTEERLSSMSNHVGNVLFWLVLLLFVPNILETLQLNGLLEPFQAMIDKLLGILPNVLAALAIGLVGWLVARLLRDLVVNLLSAGEVDKLAEHAGLSERLGLTQLIGTLVYIFVFVPALIAALDALQMHAISDPASEMLSMFLTAIPNIVAAVIILLLTYYVARFVARLLTGIASGLNVDTLPEKIGLTRLFSGEFKLSTLIGRLVLFFAMLFATAEAANRLGFSAVRDLVDEFIQFGGQILLGSVILFVGLWLANLAYDAIGRSGDEGAKGLARLARAAILGLVAAMGLRAMGIADEIVELAFGLVLGAIAVAVALSFGLGGREAAGRQMEYWLSKWRKEP
ncbi:mechanosensitive ion channel [Crenobacter sp. SG2303]|uniref:Small-conductance mechanosensitive channel n=1 Tax=Crenobacter oryzisoli TaxID=3056844 RepID=A0ABT7XTT2_9NEIS|nr:MULTISPECIES: mechanosensitive ion channel [unclassified Crenobacter]MDN0077209.1 mechanosensitive ion channel [Crenobacter sp. SG2303]MDN0085515.1 mechanosensitive ion channel [Crenobacter sp. SG2305]